MTFSSPVGFPPLIVDAFLIIDSSLIVGLPLIVRTSLLVSSPLFVRPPLLIGPFLIFRSALIGVAPRIPGCTCRACRSRWPRRLARLLASYDE